MMDDILDDPECGLSRSDQLQLKNLAQDLDATATFPREALEVIIRNHHFHLFVPRSRGGLDYSLVRGMKIIEAYARIEGNLGWIVQIGAGGGIFAAYMRREVATHFLERPDQVIAGSDFVGGIAEATEGGYQVTGEWGYASGALHATAFTGNCRLSDGLDEGKIRAFVVPSEEVKVIKNWNAMGMRATDSHSFRLEKVYVPDAHLFTVRPSHLLVQSRTAQLPFLLYARALFMPVLIGEIYRYLTLFREYVVRRNYRENTPPFSAFHNLERVWTLTRSKLYKSVTDIWESSGTDYKKSSQDIKFAKECVQHVDDLLLAVDQCHRHTGMSGIGMDSPFNVAYRNIKTASAHHLLNRSSLLSTPRDKNN